MENFKLKSNGELEPNSLVFCVKDKEIIVISEEGFKYNGVLIEDNGEIYKLAKKFFGEQIEISDEEIDKEASSQFYGTNFKYIFSLGAKWYREQLKKK